MSFPKPSTWKNKKWTQAAKGQPCTLRLPGCTGGGEDTVPCHCNGTLNKVIGGLPLGVGKKADDFNTADGCKNCHDILDDASRWPFEPVKMAKIFIHARYETIKNRLRRKVLT